MIVKGIRKESILEAITRRRKFKKGFVAKKLGVAYATLSGYYVDPLTMNGHQRIELAKILSVEENKMELICAGKLSLEEVENI